MGKAFATGAVAGLIGYMVGMSDWAARNKAAQVAQDATKTGTPMANYAGIAIAGGIVAIAAHKAFGPKAA